MTEMAETGHNHRNTVLTAVFHRVSVADRSSGLYHVADTSLVGYFDTVGEGEESVGRHGRTLKIEIEALSFLYSMFQRIDSRSLAHARCKELSVLCKHDRIALAVLHNLVGEKHIGHLCR